MVASGVTRGIMNKKNKKPLQSGDRNIIDIKDFIEN